jgi:hypothetical protein
MRLYLSYKARDHHEAKGMDVNDGVFCRATDWVEEYYGRLVQNRADFGGIAPPICRCHMGRERQMEYHSAAEGLPSFS